MARLLGAPGEIRTPNLLIRSQPGVVRLNPQLSQPSRVRACSSERRTASSGLILTETVPLPSKALTKIHHASRDDATVDFVVTKTCSRWSRGSLGVRPPQM